jgi:peptidoglycan hydrolase-like protein with peptidoglycan-binding domain
VAGLLVVLVLVVAGGAIAVVSSGASLTTDPNALARVGMPLGGGTIQSVSVLGGATDHQIPVAVRNDAIWPRVTIPAGERVSIEVVVKRPGWNSWLAGSRDRIYLTLVTPVAKPTQTYLTLAKHTPLKLSFNHPVQAVFYGSTASQIKRHALTAATSDVTLPRSGIAGTVWVAGTARTWETAPATAVSWFPSGATTAAVASPAPGTHIGPTSPITLTFSKSISAALGASRPPVSPTSAGSWQQVGDHTLVFHPTGFGYGLGATVRIGLPGGVRLVGGSGGGGTWSVAPGSTLRLQQLLATLGYLPVNFNSATAVAQTAAAQEQAAIQPPSGSFAWRWSNVPGALRAIWQPGTSGEMTKGAIMAFENDQGMIADGVPGPQVWKALITAADRGQRSAFGYTFVQVSEGSPETESTWHSGKTVVSGLVNTGIPAAPTAQGLFAVFEHALSVTMSGTNPDGSHYSDPGIPYTSYFNGGDALHGFIRGGYGYPQSLGCVEMPYSEAGAVYPYTPIGTLVDVT